MQNKKVLIGVVVVILLLVGVFFITKGNKEIAPNEAKSDELLPEGEVFPTVDASTTVECRQIKKRGYSYHRRYTIRYYGYRI